MYPFFVQDDLETHKYFQLKTSSAIVSVILAFLVLESDVLTTFDYLGV